MTERQMNDAESKAIAGLVERDAPEGETPEQRAQRHLALLRKAYYSSLNGCWIIPDWHGMTLGIEKDGYCHS